MKSCLVLFGLVSLAWFGLAAKLPSSFKICKRNDVDLNGCFARAVEYALPYLKKGIPELGIPSINPIKIESVTIAAGSAEVFDVVQKLTDVRVYGALESKVKKAELNLGTKDFQVVTYIDTKQFRVYANYDFKGKIFTLPLVGNGKAQLTMDDLQSVVTLTGNFREKQGKTYAKINNATVKVNPGKVTFKLDNLFGGNESLGNEMNKVVNDNWRVIFQDVQNGYEEALAGYYQRLFGRVFDSIPYDKLFPL